MKPIRTPINVIHNKYDSIQLLGKGRFGEVYKGVNTETNELVAIKTEICVICAQRQKPPSAALRANETSRCSHVSELNVLKHEVQILNYLHIRRCRNIPHIYWYGIHLNIPKLVMPYYEYSLFDLFTQNHPGYAKLNESYRQHKDTMDADVLMRAILLALSKVHECGVVHRDIKPHNFMIKGGDLFLIDFGMATFYVDQHFHHIKEPDTSKDHLMGTLKYISYNIHLGKEYTRRDDLISIGYMYLFMRNYLFWDKSYFCIDSPSPVNLPTNRVPDLLNTPEKYTETHILHPKNQCFKAAKTISHIDKCFDDIDVRRSPIRDYLHYVYNLTFDETPNYDIMVRYFTPKTTH
jgi:serine/threonine protein kinase